MYVMYVCIVSEGHSRTRHRTKITTDTLTAYRKSYWYQNEWPWPSFRSRIKVIALHSTLNISETVRDRLG